MKLYDMMKQYAEIENQKKALEDMQASLKRGIIAELDHMKTDEYTEADHAVKRSVFEKTKYNVPAEVKAPFAVKSVEIRVVIK